MSLETLFSLLSFMEGWPVSEGIETPGESIGFLEAGVMGGCELYNVGAGTELGSPTRAVQLRHLSSLSFCSSCGTVCSSLMDREASGPSS